MKPANENIIPLNIEDFDYNLSDERIAKYPLPQRDASKLLIYKNDVITENTFLHLVEFLPPNSLLVYNNTKVIEARLVFYRETGARIEIFCLKPAVPSDYALSLGSFSECVWKCMVG
ncbi:MAG TPA: S-adenosylmethionine:tRNA ribosyltransferase-isomerase, partial [Paludibacteraceae bacterium]|nr:S-adenosylmethionine:tRNA ribosyltransferase-isomerase [Paludibacteraceae bacterium]